MTIKPDYAHELSSFVNQRNARTTQRAEAAAGVVVAVVVAVVMAVLAAMAIVHWAMPCEAGALCMGAVLKPTGPTRPSLFLRLRMAARAWYLRVCLASVEADIDPYEMMAELEPLLRQMARQRADELRVQLMDCELATRSSPQQGLT